jgi:hypothetical protein
MIVHQSTLKRKNRQGRISLDDLSKLAAESLEKPIAENQDNQGGNGGP